MHAVLISLSSIMRNDDRLLMRGMKIFRRLRYAIYNAKEYINT